MAEIKAEIKSLRAEKAQHTTTRTTRSMRSGNNWHVANTILLLVDPDTCLERLDKRRYRTLRFRALWYEILVLQSVGGLAKHGSVCQTLSRLISLSYLGCKSRIAKQMPDISRGCAHPARRAPIPKTHPHPTSTKRTGAPAIKGALARKGSLAALAWTALRLRVDVDHHPSGTRASLAGNPRITLRCTRDPRRIASRCAPRRNPLLWRPRSRHQLVYVVVVAVLDAGADVPGLRAHMR